jgi:hypothetical protein
LGGWLMARWVGLGMVGAIRGCLNE